MSCLLLRADGVQGQGAHAARRPNKIDNFTDNSLFLLTGIENGEEGFLGDFDVADGLH